MIILLLTFFHAGQAVAAPAVQQGVEQILFMQNNGMGGFQVFCQNLSMEVATSDDIRADQVCLPAIALDTGRYEAQPNPVGYCPHQSQLSKANENGERKLTIDYLDGCSGSHSHLTCAKALCTGTMDDDGRTPISVVLKDRQHYDYKGVSGAVANFRFTQATRNSGKEHVTGSLGRDTQE